VKWFVRPTWCKSYDSKNLIFCTRYVDDILIVYDSTRVTPESILQYTNTIDSNIQLNPTQETNGNICFMDLSITRKPACLEIDIYRRPTATDTTLKSQLLHQVGLTSHFKLRMHGHTNIKIVPWYLVVLSPPHFLFPFVHNSHNKTPIFNLLAPELFF